MNRHLVFVALLLVPACQLLLPDGAPAANEGVVDAASDAGETRPDVTPPIGVDGAATFCETQGDAALFCADFDEGSVIRGFAELENDFDASVIALDSNQRVSPPSSLHITVPPNTPSCTYAMLVQPVVTAAQRFTVDVELLVTNDSQASSPPNDHVAVRIARGACDVLFVVRPDGAELRPQLDHDDGGVEQGPGVELNPFPANRFVHLTFTLDFGASPTAEVAFDHQRAGGSMVIHAACAKSVAPVRLQFGPSCVDPRPTPVEVRFDNVVMRAQ